MHPIPLIDDTLFIDNSSLEKFTTCPRSAEYYICAKRESAEERTALIFGKIAHKCLEVFYRNTEKPRDVVKAEMHAVAAMEYAAWQPPEDDFRNYGMMTNLIEDYSDAYPLEEGENVFLPSGLPAIELPFAVPLGEVEVNAELLVRDGKTGIVAKRQVGVVKVVWTGRIDRMYRSQGRLYLMDHKTTSMMGPSFFKEFELSSQVYGYVWAASKLLTESVYGFTVNAIAVRRPTKTGKSLQFERAIVPLSQPLLTEWVDDTLQIISNFLDMGIVGRFPKHTKWCVGKYGECPYRSICSLPPEHRELMLNSGIYKPVDWSPLNA